MSAITFACPECHTILKPRNPVPVGKKVQCPKCRRVFVPPAAGAAPQAGQRAPTPAAGARGSENNDWEVVEDQAPLSSAEPRRKSESMVRAEAADRYQEEPTLGKPKRKDPAEDFEAEDDEERPRPKKRHKRKATGVNQLVKLYVILGVITLVLLAGGGGVAAWMYINRDKNRGTGNEDPLAYIPPDSTVIIGVDVGTLGKQPFFGEQMEKIFKETNVNTRNFVKKLQMETGLEYKDVFDHAIWAFKQPATPGREPPGITLILKSSVAFDQHKIRKCCESPLAQKHKGKTYFRIDEGRFTTLFMPSNRTIVFTNVPEAQVHALIDSNGTQPGLQAEALALAQQAVPSQLWGVTPFDHNIKLSIQKQMAQAGPMLPANLGDAFNRAKAASLSGTLEGSAVQFQVSLACADQAGAKQAAEGMQTMWEKQGKGQVALMTAVMPKFIGGLLKEVTESLKFSSQGTMAQASAQVSLPTLETFVKEAQNQPGGGLQPAVPGS